MSGGLKTSNSKQLYVWLALALIALGIFGRFIPHPPNFAPIGAIAIFSGALLPRGLAVYIPLAAIIVSDILIGLHSTIFFTWGAFVLIAILSSNYLRGRIGVKSTLGMAVFSSVFFYLVTNFGVWLQGTMYTLDFSGLMQSYINGLPFFRYTLLGDLVYSGALFSLYYILSQAFFSHKKSIRFESSSL